MIPNGNTLVLSGFEQTKSNVSKSGVGSADNWLTGGSNTGSMERETMVIMITPTIIETDGIIEEL
jgi:type II secretory pathway component GspD/PulD (secretin)